MQTSSPAQSLVAIWSRSFPKRQDIIHGQALHRPESNDIDLYKFTVDFGPNGENRVGLFTAETFAERLTNSSSLDTYLRLYKQQQARGSSNFGVGGTFGFDFEALRQDVKATISESL